MTGQPTKPLILGKISGVFGVKGWVKIFDFSRQRGDILNHSRWLLGGGKKWTERRVEFGQVHGKTVIAKLVDCNDREDAEKLRGTEVAVWPEWLTVANSGEFYWFQLQGLEVFNLDSEPLGKVTSLIETGANDVLVVKGDRERLIPYTKNAVKHVDLENGKITVDWSIDF
jgi:16S rRNA processing protein RimM